MIKAFTLFLLSILYLTTTAQVSGLGWLRCVGGSAIDLLNANVILRNGNIVSLGYTESVDGISTGNHGNADALITCMTPDGILVWKKIVGGSNYDGDQGVAIDTTTDGNFVVAITAGSNNGDFTGNHGSYDIAFQKYSPSGTLLWTRLFGGSEREIIGSVAATPDNGIIACATTTSSSSGDVGLNHGVGTRDVWILKISAAGNIEWQKTYGGSLNESGNIYETGGVIGTTSDGGYIFSNSSQSRDGDLTGLIGSSVLIGQDDIWLVKINNTGVIQWQKAIGGSDAEDLPSLYINGSSIYLLFGSKSADRDLNGNIGLYDIALFKYNISGALLWKNQYGSFSHDNGSAISGVNGDLLTVIGSSYSSSFAGFPLNNYGQSTMLIMRIDTSNGTIKWLKDLGGNNVDNATDLKFSTDKKMYITGSSSSTDHDITGNHGNYDGINFQMDAANNIRGLAFIDINGNNLPDAGDIRPNNLSVVASKNSTIISQAFTLNGNFDLGVDTGLYVTKVNLWNNNYYIATPAAFNCNFPVVNQTCTNNIALQAVAGIKDLRVSLIPVGLTRPGTLSDFILIGYNTGTTPITSGSLVLKKDPRLTYTNFSTLPGTTSADIVSWNFTNLRPFDSIKYRITMYAPPPPALTAADTLKFKAEILPVSGDAYPTDNTLYLFYRVINSFDPNVKVNLHGDLFPITDVQNENFINYVIQFQNTGNAEALDIVIKDTLSSKYLMGSMEMISSSHPYDFSLKDSVATWRFANINLPDSNVNEPGSHGYISFRIKAKPSVISGSVIVNRAAIYFDYNPPVITATDSLKIYTPVVPAPPAAPVLSPAGDTTYCNGIIVLRSNSTGIHLWYKNSVLIPGENANTLSVSSTGNYSATVSNGQNSPMSNIVRVLPGSIQPPLIGIVGNTISVFNPDPLLIYTWQNFGTTWTNMQPTVSGITFSPAATGVYRVNASKGICNNVSVSKSYTKTSGSAGNNPLPGITGNIYIHPNPVKDILYIKNIDPYLQWETTVLINSKAQVLVPGPEIRGLSSFSLNVSDLLPGTYYIKLMRAGSPSRTLQFIKIK